MDQSISPYSHSLFGGGEILGVATNNAPKSSPTPVTPSTILFSPQKSPKGPRPPPSAVSAAHDHARAIADVEPSSLFFAGPSSPAHHIEQVPFDYASNTNDDHARNETEKLTNSLLSATSASPPPFARATRRTMSASSSASSQSGSPLDSNTKGDSPAVPATQAPNPWVEQATLNSCPPPASADNPSGSPESPTINRINQLGKEGALSRIHGRKRSEHDVPVQTNETAATQHDGSELDRTQFDSSAPAPDLVAGLTNSMYLANSSNGMTRIDDNSQEDNVKEVAISATFERASLQPTGSLIIDSDVPAIQEDLSILHSNQKSSPLPIPVPIPSRNPPSTMLQIPITPNSIKSSSSHLESSHIPHSLAESTTWEKVEGIYDEWQELSNPREEVVVMSESDGSDNEDDLDDEAEWEASRKVGANGNAMADSAFLPSVQRRRRVAATATKEETGRATPTPSTGRRVENPKPHGGELSEDALASSYFMATGPAPSHVPKRLTPQQEQIVAELKRARITPGEVKSYSRQRDNLRHGSPAVLLPSIW